MPPLVQDGQMTEPFRQERYDILREATLKIIEESGLTGPETVSVSLK